MRKVTSRQTRRVCAGRRISGCLALAAAAALASSANATQYTWTGTSGTSWETNTDWNPTTGHPSVGGTVTYTANSSGVPTAGTGDIATFAGTASSFSNMPTLTTSESIGELLFSSAAGGWTINANSGDTLTLNGTGITAGLAINDLANTGGTDTINAGLIVGANETWEVGAGGTLLINGTVADTSLDSSFVNTLTFAGGGTIKLTAANSYDANVTVTAGTLDLTSNGTIEPYVLTLTGGTLLLDNSGTPVSGRLGSGSLLNYQTYFNGGSFVLNGNASTQVSETLGAAYISAASPTTLSLPATESILTVSPASGGSSSAAPTLTMSSLTRITGGGVLFVNGTGLGSGGYGQIYVTSAPTTSGSGSVGTPSAPIVPFLVGEVSTGISGAPGGSAAIGTQYGTPNTFVTAYSTGNGYALRPLNPATEFSPTVVSGDNIYVSSGTTSSATTSINSLVVNGGDLTVADGTTLTDSSGALLYVTNNSVKPSSSTGAFTFGSTEGIISVDNGIVGMMSAPITGSSAITVDGPGTFAITGTGSTYSGTITTNLGSLQFGTNSAGGDGTLPAAATVNVSQYGNLNIANASNTSLPFTIAPLGGSNVNFIESNAATVPVNIELPSGSVSYINFNNTAPITVSASTTTGTNAGVAINAAAGRYYLIFNGAAVNITGNVDGDSTTSYTEDIYDRTSSPISFSGSDNYIVYAANIYFQSVNNNSILPNQTITVPAGGLLKTYYTYSTSRVLYIDSQNNNINTGYAAYPNQLPPAGSFVDHGTVDAYIIYEGGSGSGGSASIGETRVYVNGTSTTPGVMTADLYTGLSGNTLNTSSNSLIVGPNGTETSMATSGYGYKLSLALNTYTYINVVGPSGTLTDGTSSQAGTNDFWFGLGGDDLLEIGGSSNGITSAVTGASSGTAKMIVSDGAGASNTFSLGGSPGFVFDDSGTATELGVVNIFSGGTLNWQPGIASDTNFIMGTTSGQLAVMNVYGGQFINSGYNSPIIMGEAAGVNAILNLDADSSGNVGKAVTSYIGATASNSSAFINFNGGELEYSDVPATSNTTSTPTPQTNFITTSVAGGVRIYSKGAIIGTDANGFAPSSTGTNDIVTISSALVAPSGEGITSINPAASGGYTGGVGYTSPPLVTIASSDGKGSGATAYAVINSSGTVINIVVTNPGSGYDAVPTISFADGGAPGSAGASYTFVAAKATASVAPNATTGGLTKVDNLDLNLSGTDTYGGATVIEQGILALSSASTNNIAKSSIIVVGDTLADGLGSSTVNYTPASTSAVPASVNGAALYTNNSVSGYGISNASGFVLASGQTLSGFGSAIATGGTAAGFTLGAGSVIAPGSTPALGTNLGGSSGITTPQTGALKITTGGSSPATTALAGGSSYYWKVNTNSAGGATFSGYSPDPTTGYTVPALTSNNTNVSGTNWDAVVVDSISTSSLSPTSQFTVNAVGFAGSGSSPVNFSNGTSYAWVIAHAADTTVANLQAQIMAGDFVLNTSGTLTSSSYNGQNYGYGLDAQTDPFGGSDLVVNYAPVPEPTALALLAPAAGAMLLRRRRRETASA